MPPNPTEGGAEPLIESQMYDIIDRLFASDATPSYTSLAEDIHSLFQRYCSKAALNDRQVHSTKLQPDNDNTPEQFLYAFWSIIAGAGEQIPYNQPPNLSNNHALFLPLQDRLIQLILALRILPNPRAIDLGTQWGSSVLWTDLPLLGPVLRDFVNVYDGQLNYEGFIARVTVAGISDFSRFGFHTFYEALEPVSAPESRGDRLKRYDDTLPSTVVWLEIAGKQLWGVVVTREQNGDAGLPEQPWHTAGGPSKNKWNFWRGRLWGIAEDDQLKMETRDLAEKALQLMSALESASGDV